MNLQLRGPAAAAILIVAAIPVSAEQNNLGAALPPTTLTRSSEAADTTLWAAIKNTGYRELFELYLEKFPNSPNAHHAYDAISAIDGEPTTVDKAAATAALLAKRTRPQVMAIFLNRSDGTQVDLARLQRDLVSRGCNAGSPDGVWGARSMRAAKRFVRATGLNIDGSAPSTALSEAVAAASGDICGDFVRRAPSVASSSARRPPVFRNSPTRARDRRRRQ